MSETRKQHYIQRSLLKHFSNTQNTDDTKNKLKMAIKSNKTNDLLKGISVYKAANKKDLYESEYLEPNEIEEKLSHFEKKFSELLNNIRNQCKSSICQNIFLTNNEINTLFQFIDVQHTRTVRMKNLIWREVSHRLKNEYGDDFFADCDDIESLKNGIFAYNLLCVMDNDISESRIAYFKNYDYEFIRLIDENSCFVIGDCPVIPIAIDSAYVTSLLVPISSSIAIMIEPKGNSVKDGMIYNCGEDICEIINALMIAYADEYVYMSPSFTNEKYKKYLGLSNKYSIYSKDYL